MNMVVVSTLKNKDKVEALNDLRMLLVKKFSSFFFHFDEEKQLQIIENLKQEMYFL